MMNHIKCIVKDKLFRTNFNINILLDIINNRNYIWNLFIDKSDFEYDNFITTLTLQEYSELLIKIQKGDIK